MEGRTDKQAGIHPGELSQRLRAHDVEATALFLGSRIGAVHHYCASVCGSEFVLESVQAAFAHFYETLDADEGDDSRLEQALLRCTRLAAGQWASGRAASAAGREGQPFACEMTPLVLAGSPEAPAGVAVLRQMRGHVRGCRRCQDTESRFIAADAAFVSSAEPGVSEDVLKAVLDRLPPHEGDHEQRREEKDEQDLAGNQVEGDEQPDGAEGPESGEVPSVGARESGRESAWEPEISQEDADRSPATTEPGAGSRAAVAGRVLSPAGSALNGAARANASSGTRLSLKQVLLAAGVAAMAAIALVVVLAGGSDSGGDDAAEDRPAAEPAQARSPQPAPSAGTPAEAPVALTGAKAVDFDPNGGNGERPEQVRNVIDGNPSTAWQTELYPAGAFGQGVGIYIALGRTQPLSVVRLRTPSPGWDAEIYGATEGPPAQLTSAGWEMLASKTGVRTSETIALGADARPVRYCLVWVRRLPPGTRLASIAEISLLARR